MRLATEYLLRERNGLGLQLTRRVHRRMNLDPEVSLMGDRQIDHFHCYYKRICRAVGISVSGVATTSAEAPLNEQELVHSEISASRMSEVLKHFRLDETMYFAEEHMKSNQPLTAKQICVLLDARKDRKRTDGVKWVDYYDADPDKMWEINRSAKRTLKKYGISLPAKNHVKSNGEQVN